LARRRGRARERHSKREGNQTSVEPRHEAVRDGRAPLRGISGEIISERAPSDAWQGRNGEGNPRTGVGWLPAADVLAPGEVTTMSERATKRVLPRVEALEDRAVPAVSLVQSGTTLYITGDARNDSVTYQEYARLPGYHATSHLVVSWKDDLGASG